MHITESYCPYLCTGLLKAERRRVMDGEARELSLREVSPTEATPSPRLNQRQRVQRVQQQQSSKTGDAAENFSPSVPTVLQLNLKVSDLEELLTLTPHSLKSCLCHFAGEGSTVEESVSISPQLTKWIKDNAEDLKIRQGERSWAAAVVNDFRENLLKFLRSSSDQPFFQTAEFLTTGSYFEKVKIHSPDEFDMMLKLQAPSRLIMTELDHGLFYRLDLNRATRSPIQAFLLENERTLSSSKVLSEIQILQMSEGVNKRMCHLCISCTTNTECMCACSQCHCLIRLFCLSASESWRISFSLIEKKMITSHGNTKTCCESNATKCCRKQCLMLLKSLIEGLKQRFPKELDDLCSYHGKTVFLHTLSIRYSSVLSSTCNYYHSSGCYCSSSSCTSSVVVLIVVVVSLYIEDENDVM
uniref:Uncharacterized protein n=1 Tax=Seriola lalandi dorsalis TaxID=1841481 RepID=A0A3B4YP27_SERLL